MAIFIYNEYSSRSYPVDDASMLARQIVYVAEGIVSDNNEELNPFKYLKIIDTTEKTFKNVRLIYE